jgi:adenine-specific DNA methylase
MDDKSFIEVQFPIGPLSLESYNERRVSHGKVLSLGKWWGEKPLVLTRAIILGAVFPAADDPERWPDDLDIFLKCLCLDNAGMWKRKTELLPPRLCFEQATEEERQDFFDDSQWLRATKANALTAARRAGKEMQASDLVTWWNSRRAALEKRVFYTLSHAEQRPYCCRVEEIDGPSEESWAEINAYLRTSATSLAALVQELAKRRFGCARFKVGDAFSGTGAIPFAAAELGCDVFASDLNPVAALLTWGALHLIGGDEALLSEVIAAQERIYRQVDDWILEKEYETSEEGWRGDIYFYCIEVRVPEWDGWAIPVAPSWVIVPKSQTWVELVPIEEEKRFAFHVIEGGEHWQTKAEGTKEDSELLCPPSLWEIFKREGRAENTPRRLNWKHLIENAGGLRKWEKSDVVPRPGDFLQERLYCIRWRTPDWVDKKGNTRKGEFVYREPRQYDLENEQKVLDDLTAVFDEWQQAGWIPSWRIEPGEKTNEPIRTRGWTYWHHLFTPRQLLIGAQYSRQASQRSGKVRGALTLLLGTYANFNARLARWHATAGNGAGATEKVYYNQALNTLFDYANRSWASLQHALMPDYGNKGTEGEKSADLCDAREVIESCALWITDPPYADAVNYDELSEFFLAWYVPHLKACFPDWYTDSMRFRAVKGDDAPFRVAMAECYRNLAEHMPDNGMQVLMFTHKSTDVWEDLALIMWAAGLQVKQVWSVATETPGVGIRTGNYVQATYNMVLRKRNSEKVGFIDFITPQVNKQVREVITHMRESQIEGGFTRCGYTDTDYLLAAQAAAAEVITSYASIDGIDLEAELRIPNAERRRSALRTLMENAKRTATDFLVPPVMDQAIKKAGRMNVYQFWRDFSPEEKFLLKGLEQEAQGVFKIGAFQDLGRAYGLSDYESLLGPTRANDTRTKLPDEFPRPEATRFDEVPAEERMLWRYSPTRHIYHALKLLHGGADIDRAVKHLVDSTDFWNIRTTRLAVILAYVRETTAHMSHWAPYKDPLITLEIGVENWKA